jgi:hypothetical protein
VTKLRIFYDALAHKKGALIRVPQRALSVPVSAAALLTAKRYISWYRYKKRDALKRLYIIRDDNNYSFCDIFPAG